MKKVMFGVFALLAAGALSAAESVNLADKCPVTASSQESAQYAAANVTNGQGSSRWSSLRTDDEWIMVDLGAAKEVGQVVLEWERAAGKEYVVQFSLDGTTFTDVFTKKDGKQGAKEVIQLKPQSTRYVRIQGKKRATQFGYSLWAIKVYAASDNLALFASVKASSEQVPHIASKAVDGNDATRWGSGRTDNEWIMLDLGESKTVGRMVLKWEAAAGKEYAVQFSQDGANFTDVFTKTDGKSKAVENITIDPQETRYIRILGKKRTTEYGYSLWEIEAYAK